MAAGLGPYMPLSRDNYWQLLDRNEKQLEKQKQKIQNKNAIPEFSENKFADAFLLIATIFFYILKRSKKTENLTEKW